MSDRNVDEIRARLARERVQMADAVGDLAASANPKNVARQGMDQAKAFVNQEVSGVKTNVHDTFVEPDGSPKWRNVLIVGGVVVGVVTFAVVMGVRNNRQEKEIQRRIRKAIEARA